MRRHKKQMECFNCSHKHLPLKVRELLDRKLVFAMYFHSAVDFLIA